MFMLGMFWKRTTGNAALAGVITGFVLSVFFNNYAPSLLGNETVLYTAYPNGKGGYEIPFLINMGWSFFFTLILMILISLTGPKVNPKAFDFDKGMFRMSKKVIALITFILMILAALYIRFW
jgi:SSS family solute:Na+ symporter